MINKITKLQSQITKSNILNYGLALFFFILPWQTRWIFGDVTIGGDSFQYGIASIYLTQVLLVVVLALVTKLKWEKLYRTPVIRGIIAVWVAAVLSIFFGLNKALAGVGILQLVFAMILFLMMIDKRVDLKLMMKAFVAGLILPVFLGVYQFVVGSSGASTLLGLASRSAEVLGDSVILQGDKRILRAYGSFPHPNIFGGYLAVGLMAVFALSQSAKKQVEKYFVWISGIILSIGLVLTFSRSAWAGFVIASILGLIILLVKDVKRAKLIAFPASAVMIGFIVSMVLFSPAITSRLPGREILESASVTERVQQYKEYTSVISGSDLITGVGIGSYTLAVYEEYPTREWWEYQPIHNIPLLVLGEIGILGLLAVMFWAGSNDKINFRRFPNVDAVAAFMMGNVILTILFLDHYIWSSWSGIVLAIFMMALTARMGED